MAKISVKAKEITNTDVTGVALVKHGAVRIPFRMVKSETEKDTNMSIDLGRIGDLFKSETPATPEVSITAVIFKSDVTEDAAKAFVESMDLSFDNIVKADDSFIALQGEAKDLDGTHLLKMDESTAIAVQGMEKAFSGFDFESEEFAEVMKTEGFWPAMHMGMDVMRYTVDNILSKSEDAGSAAQKIAKAANDFGNYMSMLAESLPQKSFKSEQALAKSALAKSAAEGEGEDADLEKGDYKGKSKGEEDMDKKGKNDDKAKDMAKSEVADAGEDKGAEDVAKSEDAPATPAFDADAFLGQIGDKISESMSALEDKLTKSFDEKLSKTTEAMDGLKEEVEKTDSTLSKTLLGGRTPADMQTSMSKSEEAEPPLMDTAYHDL